MRDRPAVVLTRHFFTSLFDFGFLSDDGAESLKRVLLGGLAAGDCRRPAARARLHGEVRGCSPAAPPEAYARRSSPTTRSSWRVPMWIVAVADGARRPVAVPRRDRLSHPDGGAAVAPDVFGAKLAALLLFGGLFVVGIASRPAAARRAHADRRGEDGLDRPRGAGLRRVEPGGQPVRGARRSSPSTACSCCSRRAAACWRSRARCGSC